MESIFLRMDFCIIPLSGPLELCKITALIEVLADEQDGLKLILGCNKLKIIMAKF